jgi:hypothetical protein
MHPPQSLKRQRAQKSVLHQIGFAPKEWRQDERLFNLNISQPAGSDLNLPIGQIG